MELGDPDFQSAFIIGHGIGSISGYFRGKRIKTAEIDEAVVELSRRYFDCADDNVTIGDGRLLLEAELERSLDYIVLDAFTGKGIPPHLTTADFFQMASVKLRTGGALILNMMGRPRDDRLTEAVGTTLRSTGWIAARSDCARSSLRKATLFGTFRRRGRDLILFHDL